MARFETFLYYLLITISWQIHGFTSGTGIFLKTGEDLFLNVTQAEIPTICRLWVWRFGDYAIVSFSKDSEAEVELSHKGKIEILQNGRVKLNNLNKSDSGIYTAEIVLPIKKKLAEYNVTVQDPVSPAVLTITCVSSNSSLRILTVTCKAEDSSISSALICEKQTCKQELKKSRMVTKSGSSLHIYHTNESIICNHSNQVSWKESIKKIEDDCIQIGESRNRVMLIILVTLVVSAVIAVCILIIRSSGCQKGNKDMDNTIYACPVVEDSLDRRNETVKDEDCSPTTTYSTVGASSKESTKSRFKDQPETVYAQVNKASR
ncbi:uncharacterized protein LOC119779946 [Cyprinodon tularosa]|uniref:uncharacterized protein LOC119779946 n=1 Tax=Cyprinodon tularosa TaxID=77115 RepID=UPI0018E28293|nr:uncharacterized protein LOC119779946 [Cyprinodon tularosa]